MKTMKEKTVRILSVAALAAILVAGCGRGRGDTLATVAGEPITFEQFNNWLEVKPTARVLVNNQPVELPVADTLGFQAMQDLITQRLLLQMAQDFGVMPSNQDVVQELDFQQRLNPQFVEQLKASRGMNLDQIREALRLELVQYRLQTLGGEVSMEEVEQYIRENPREFIEPATVDMLWIFVTNERLKQDADRDLAAGQNFSTVAIRYSQFPGARQAQGRFPQRVIAALPPEVRRMVETTPVGAQSDWMRVQGGWAKFQIERKTEERPIDMNDDRKKLVQRQLSQRRAALAIDLGRRLADRLRESKIEVTYEPLKGPWTRLMERLRELEELQAGGATRAATETPATNEPSP